MNIYEQPKIYCWQLKYPFPNYVPDNPNLTHEEYRIAFANGTLCTNKANIKKPHMKCTKTQQERLKLYLHAKILTR